MMEVRGLLVTGTGILLPFGAGELADDAVVVM